MAKKMLIAQMINETAMVIVYQSHRGGDFGRKRSFWWSSYGYCLQSATAPQLLGDTLYVRGVSIYDHRIIDAGTPERAKQLLSAVEEYNKTFSGIT